MGCNPAEVSDAAKQALTPERYLAQAVAYGKHPQIKAIHEDLVRLPLFTVHDTVRYKIIFIFYYKNYFIIKIFLYIFSKCGLQEMMMYGVFLKDYYILMKRVDRVLC